jgi:hypothetical protein
MTKESKIIADRKTGHSREMTGIGNGGRLMET